MGLEVVKLQDKIKSQYLQRIKLKLESDIYYNKLRQALNNAINHSAPMVKIMNGSFEQIVPESVSQIKDLIQEYIISRYPILHYNGQLPYRASQLYDAIDIHPPEKLPLTHIETRLELFNLYMRYKLNSLSIYQDMFYYDCLSFNEWLYIKHYDGLVFIDWDRYIN